MDIERDPAKDTLDRANHGLAFADFAGFDAEPAVIEDTRFDYGERRWHAVGRIDGVPHAIVFTMRGDALRLIGFRRAHEQELRSHE